MMFEKHPVPDDFERFLHSSLADSTRNAQLIRHLLADCPTCRQRLDMMGWDQNRLEHLLRLPGTDVDASVTSGCNAYDYDKAFAGSERTLAEVLSLDLPAERSPEDLSRELATLPPSEQLQRVSNDSQFVNPQLARWLVERSHAARYEDADKMLHLAQLAQLAADACSTEMVGSERRLADLRAQAWGQFGNALRVSGKLRQAEDAMATAGHHRAAGTGEPLLHARLLEQMASLHIFQRRFQPAIELANEAGRIYRDIGETHQLASTLVQKAIASFYSGEAARAAEILNKAIPLMDHEEDPHLLLAACHNLVLCYIDLDQPEQALELYSKSRELYKEFKDTLILLRAAWQEGRLLRDLGHLRAAETALLRARSGFVERGLAYEAAVVSLDLASVHVRLGALEEMRQTLTETMPIFHSLRIGREALGAIIQLQQIAHQEHQALELIREITARLEKLSGGASLRP